MMCFQKLNILFDLLLSFLFKYWNKENIKSNRFDNTVLVATM